MTLAYEVIATTPEHLRDLSLRLRAGDAAECQAAGMSSHSALWRSYRASHYRRSFMVGGKLAAVGGCSGSLLSPLGHPWLLTAAEVEDVPLAFVREARREIRGLLEVHSLLRNYVDRRYTKALGFLRLLGFAIGEEGDGVAVGGTLFLPFSLERR